MTTQLPSPPLAWLGRRGATRLGLAVVGYQFPGLLAPKPPPDDWDRNWLMIRGEMECARGSWAFEDPCLTTWELAALCDWLAALPDPTPPAPEIHFTEPLLAFAAAGADGADHLLRLRLKGEALPPHHDHETRWHTGIELTLRVAPEELRAFVDAMRRQFARYPRR